MVNDAIDIRKLTLEELSSVVETYPWFSAARKELCVRMSRLGDVWPQSEFAKAALYLNSRRYVFELVRGSSRKDCSDKDVEKVLKSFQETPKPRIIAVGSDYFTQSEYDGVRRDSDGIYSSFAATSGNEDEINDIFFDDDADFCTETLAEVYLDQDYPEKAKEIYSRLSLRYPEKSSYFATLIEKIDKKI